MKSTYYQLTPTNFQSFGIKMVAKWNLCTTSSFQQIFSHLGLKWLHYEIHILQAHSNKFSVIWDKNGRTKKSVCYKLIPINFKSFGTKMVALLKSKTSRFEGLANDIRFKLNILSLIRHKNGHTKHLNTYSKDKMHYKFRDWDKNGHTTTLFHEKQWRLTWQWKLHFETNPVILTTCLRERCSFRAFHK